MGVYIKGMEMPKEGEYIKIHANGLAVKIIYDESKMKSVPKDGLGYYAKAVPVPPHGRLIDADALLEDVRQSASEQDAENLNDWWVGAMPTILEAEEGE